MTYDALLGKVYDAYFECRRKKRNKDSMIRFEMDYETHLRELTDDLYYGRYDLGTAIVFAVTRPKVREVFAAQPRDRVVHHLIMREFGSVIDREMIDDSFSCRVGKGVQFGVQRLREQIMEVSDDYKETAYTLSMDINGFFMSIDKGKCYDMIDRLLREKCGDNPDIDWWLSLIRQVVMNRPELNCEIHGDKSLLDNLPDNKTLFRSGGKGFPIGNLTSQIFGNFYLTPFDKWSIAYLGDDGEYSRYVDDIRATSRDSKLLMRYYHDARIWLCKNAGLTLHPRKWSLQEVHKGIPFIGSVIKPWGIYAGNRLVDNAFGMVRNRCGFEKYVQRLNSYFGFLIHTLSYGIRWQMWKAIPGDIKNRLISHAMTKVSIRPRFRKKIENRPLIKIEYHYHYESKNNNTTRDLQGD